MSLTVRGTGKEVLVNMATRTVGSCFCGSCDFWIVKRRVTVELRKREAESSLIWVSSKFWV